MKAGPSRGFEVPEWSAVKDQASDALAPARHPGLVLNLQESKNAGGLDACQSGKFVV